MAYLAITQGTADWLQSKAAILDGLAEMLLTSGGQLRGLEDSEFAEGPIRIAASKRRDVIAFWNTDYLAGTGEEAWGFILIDSDGGLLGAPEIIREVLERCVYVVNQRLQRLIIDGAYIHRSHENGAHTLLAGRGSKARRYSIGYYEGLVGTQDAPRSSVVCIGPTNDPRFYKLTDLAVREGAKLPNLAQMANSLAFATTSRPLAKPDLLQALRERLAPYTRTQSKNEYASVEVTTNPASLNIEPYRVQGLSYADWTKNQSPLTDVQRRILDSGALDKHPLRIVGPGGSGKTLLMQLLAIRVLEAARRGNRKCRILYVVHNSAMREKVEKRFDDLLSCEPGLIDSDRVIEVLTLSEYGRTQLGLELTSVIDADASEAKEFQLEQVMEALQQCFLDRADLVKGSDLLTEVKASVELQEIFAMLLMAEISISIKGHGLEADRKRYIESQRKLSRLHGVLSPKEREFVFDTFGRYHQRVFETFQVLDTDDVALSLLGRLRTPLWELKRRELGYDYIFVDETQLFNENERRVLPLLTKGLTEHVPIALALDEAQQLYGQTTAGLATLGIKNITNESLPSIHRSTRSIVRLAFFVIQRCIDLFNADFPDFTKIAQEMAPDTHPLAQPPRYEHAQAETGVGALVLSIVNRLRRDNLRQIAVVCHADQYWSALNQSLNVKGVPLFVLEQRGEKLPLDQPIVVLGRPAQIGGQEFDAVILVGLEQGIVPPRAAGNDALSAAVEQQALREMYLSITRARYALVLALSHRAALTPVMREAVKAGLLCATT